MTSADPPVRPAPHASPAPHARPAALVSLAAPPEPITWPDGVSAAACLTFDMDAVADVARHTASLNLPARHCPPPVMPPDAYWVARPTDEEPRLASPDRRARTREDSHD